jgi:hypothetical protein
MTIETSAPPAFSRHTRIQQQTPESPPDKKPAERTDTIRPETEIFNAEF